MKSYEVEWEDDASSALAQLYLHSSEPNSLWPAQHRADRRLEQAPRTAGRELSEGLWQIIEHPLKIHYEIDDTKRTVTVTHVDMI